MKFLQILKLKHRINRETLIPWFKKMILWINQMMTLKKRRLRIQLAILKMNTRKLTNINTRKLIKTNTRKLIKIKNQETDSKKSQIQINRLNQKLRCSNKYRSFFYLKVFIFSTEQVISSTINLAIGIKRSKPTSWFLLFY